MELKKIKLNKLSDDALAQRQLQGIKGGGADCCTCGCYYANQGGSSRAANDAANTKNCYGSTRPGVTYLPPVVVTPHR
ncbi:TIGR04149 family rSAM-modified RiPP [uncultured Porphyromonas sp.]|uniref:TIGR04149 family rSAM-modified RiPP n=1 Tax=uncultured Porphyromonas sp. TaxID=159274 RepID=UPI00261461DE|nr:TIGR04149 family rSAM-modified RiPP [uncultured Porphyromonas sp.]